MNKNRIKLIAATTLLGLSLLLAACGGNSTATPTAPAAIPLTNQSAPATPTAASNMPAPNSTAGLGIPGPSSTNSAPLPAGDNSTEPLGWVMRS